jgi:hypothetical protein
MEKYSTDTRHSAPYLNAPISEFNQLKAGRQVSYFA